MKTCRRLALLAFALALLGVTGSDPSVGRFTIGMNYNWWRLRPVDLPACQVGTPANKGDSILGAYQDEGVRETVRSQLAAMHHAGFESLRIFVWHRRPMPSKPGDPWLVSDDGNIDGRDRDKLRAFVGDIASAGFTNLEVSPSFIGPNWLYCQRESRGDCFDPSRTEENWRFTRQTAQIVLAAAGALNVRFDLMNEGAPGPSMPAQTLQNAKTYLQTIAGRFQAEFGPIWLISAPFEATRPDVEINRTNLLLSDLAEAGLSPKFVELHSYTDDPDVVSHELDAMQAIAIRLGAHIVFGEMLYHNDSQVEGIERWLVRNPSSRVVDFIEWPATTANGDCQLHPAPPYTPGALETLHGAAR